MLTHTIYTPGSRLFSKADIELFFLRYLDLIFNQIIGLQKQLYLNLLRMRIILSCAVIFVANTTLHTMSSSQALSVDSRVMYCTTF